MSTSYVLKYFCHKFNFDFKFCKKVLDELISF
jgi:hypothetical protein